MSTFYTAIRALAIATPLVGILVLASGRLRRWRLAYVAIFGLVFVLRTLTYLSVDEDGLYWDFKVFWTAGKSVAAGMNPYEPSPTEWRPLNPPNSMVFMRAMALMPLREGGYAWLVLNQVLGLAVVPLVALTVRGRDEEERDASGALDRLDLATLSLVVAGALSIRLGVIAGQFALWTAAFLFLGLALDRRARPGLAGVCFALATPKIGTVIPFLLLFLRRDAWRFWLAFTATVAAMVLLVFAPTEIPGIARRWLDAIRYYSSDGRVNDYASPNIYKTSAMVSLDYMLWKFGLRDRGLIGGAQLAILGVWGLLVAHAVFRRGRDRRTLTLAIVSAYSCLFLYHRLYDLVMLTVPLIYGLTTARSRKTHAWRRAASLAAVASFVAMNIPNAFLMKLDRRFPAGSLPYEVVQHVVLPAGSWLVLVVAAFLFVDLYLGDRGRPPDDVESA